jgi:hypothetical protein
VKRTPERFPPRNKLLKSRQERKDQSRFLKNRQRQEKSNRQNNHKRASRFLKKELENLPNKVERRPAPKSRKALNQQAIRAKVASPAPKRVLRAKSHLATQEASLQKDLKKVQVTGEKQALATQEAAMEASLVAIAAAEMRGTRAENPVEIAAILEVQMAAVRTEGAMAVPATEDLMAAIQVEARETLAVLTVATLAAQAETISK